GWQCWITSCLKQALSLGDSFRGIQLQQLDGGAAFWRDTDQFCPAQHEVLRPHLRAGIEEETEATRQGIEGAEIRPLMAITAPAGEGQIGVIGAAAVFEGNNVIDFVRKEGDIRGKQAIFAALAGAVEHLSTERGWNRALRHGALVR